MTAAVQTRTEPAARVVPGTPWRRKVAAALVVFLLLGAPWTLGSYEISLLSTALVIGLLAMSVNLLTGVTGLPSLGQTAYFGVGTYTAAILGREVTAVGPVQVAAAAALGAGVAALTGPFAIRARGVPFLMLTLAIGELAYTVARNWTSVTNGTDGMGGIPAVVPFWGIPPLDEFGAAQDGLTFYYVLAVFGILFAAVMVVVRSPFGLTLRGIRDNEARMRATGYPVTRYLLSGYVVAGAMAGAAGGLWITLSNFASPDDIGFQMAALAPGPARPDLR